MRSNIEAFRNAINNDPAIQQEVVAITNQDEGIIDSSSALSELGKSYGYEFSAQEAEDYQVNMDGDELSDFELEMVSAGMQAKCNAGLPRV